MKNKLFLSILTGLTILSLLLTMGVGTGYLSLGMISGTPSASTYLRGDLAWATPVGAGTGAYMPPVVAANNATAAEKATVTISGGLQCDGTADQTEINTYLVNAGDTVQLTSGTYNLTSSILYTKDGQQILTAGWKTIVTSASYIDLISSTINGGLSSNGCYLAPITLDGNSETCARGIFAQYLMRWVIDRPNIHQFKDWGIQLASVDGHTCTIRQPWIWSNGVTSALAYSGGIKIGSEHDELNLCYPVVNVEGGLIEWNKDGIWSVSTTETRIHAVIEGNKRHGVAIYTHAGYINSHIDINDCYFELNNASDLGGYDIYIKGQNEASYHETVKVDYCRPSPSGPAKFLYVENTGSPYVEIDMCNMGAISGSCTFNSAVIRNSNSS